MKLHDKAGNELTGQEYISRWKQGMQKVTALQTTKINLVGNSMILVGILIGIYSTFITKTWWLVIILVGSLFLSLVSMFGMMQKYMLLKEMEKKLSEIKKEMEGGQNNEQESTT